MRYKRPSISSGPVMHMWLMLAALQGLCSRKARSGSALGLTAAGRTLCCLLTRPLRAVERKHAPGA